MDAKAATMTLPIGRQRISAGSDPASRGFTLIELILVMALLVVVLSIAAPSLSRFFRGRDLESEAHRFLALTRYGQNLAVSEGIPYLLWIDRENREYGLRAELSLDDIEEEESHEPLVYSLARGLQLEMAQQVTELTMPATNTLQSLTHASYTPWKRSLLLVGNLPTIRFTSEGFISETSPQAVGFREGEAKADKQDALLWVGQNRTRLNFEIWTNPPASLRR
jgi:type II secretion system protein H